MDMNLRKMKKSDFRISKTPRQTVLRLRVPGGDLDATLLAAIQNIATTYGTGRVHLTLRQGFEIPGIDFADMPAVNELLQPIIDDLELTRGASRRSPSPAGTRNVSACIGSRVCPYACFDTTALARRIEREVFPNDLHFNIALTGCHADCAGVRLYDFGVIGMTRPEYDSERCVSCGACIRECRRTVEALREINYKVERDPRRCIGCGDCVRGCPTGAWTRSREKYFRLVVMGRTGKRNPRLGEHFIKWADAESIIRILHNSRDFVKNYRDSGAPGGKEHIGHIIDRVGFEEYRKIALAGITLPEVAEVRKTMYWGGVTY